MNFKQILSVAFYFLIAHVALVLVIYRIVYYHFPVEWDYDGRIMVVILWIYASFMLWYCRLRTTYLLSNADTELRDKMLVCQDLLWGLFVTITLFYEGAFGYMVLVPSMLSKAAVYPVIVIVDHYLCVQACKKLLS